MTKQQKLMGIATIWSALAIAFSDAAEPRFNDVGVLTDVRGHTLYNYEADVANSDASNCNGPCAVIWPPLKVEATDVPKENFSTMTRKDGSKQWTYKGKPVYLWLNDKKPGDMTGEAVAKWKIVRK